MDYTNIDFSQTVHSEEIELALSPLKGVLVLLSALELSAESGESMYQKHGYAALSLLCHETINNFEKMKPKLDYMQALLKVDKVKK
jgi:hypothetical protein